MISGRVGFPPIDSDPDSCSAFLTQGRIATGKKKTPLGGRGHILLCDQLEEFFEIDSCVHEAALV